MFKIVRYLHNCTEIIAHKYIYIINILFHLHYAKEYDRASNKHSSVKQASYFAFTHP